MSKKELINRVYESVEQNDVSKATLKQIIDTTLESIMEMVIEEGECRLVGFATLKSYKRKARKAMHPITREPITVPEKTSVKIILSNDFKEALQKSNVDE